MTKHLHQTEPDLERAVLIGVELPHAATSFTLDDSLEELGLLAETAGAEVVGVFKQKLPHPDPARYLGKGKLAEIGQARDALDFSLAIFDDELSPTQQRNIEKALGGVKVLDRTALILDIFARRAQTHEGRLQVELAQMQYLLPRLAGQWSHLERLGGGIGTRGPGETQIETDRRIVRQRISRLQRELETVRQHRGRYRARRRRSLIPVAALVGYTNAGKSTLLNALTDAGVLAENKLFATLDPITRKVTLPGGAEILLTDTVGFIQKLPTSLVAAFRATLEELTEADLLVHVVDITHENAAEQSETVDRTLEQLGAADKPRLLVLNKVDRLLVNGIPLEESEHLFRDYAAQVKRDQPDAVLISARLGWGLHDLLIELERRLAESDVAVAVRIPYAQGKLVNLFRTQGLVETEHHDAEGTFLEGRIPAKLRSQFAPYVLSDLGAPAGQA
ncbi:MAG TPA: GTPase HflX [Dehalococcoidia bacterium]|nr:GTPase HflX [Dehalococcoidia bacterium]